MTMNTDYTPGDEPIPVGTIVLYAYTEGSPAKEYKVVDQMSPTDHPHPPAEPILTEAYPDNVAYVLWPVGIPQKFGNRDQCIGWVRRTSFRVKPLDAT